MRILWCNFSFLAVVASLFASRDNIATLSLSVACITGTALLCPALPPFVLTQAIELRSYYHNTNCIMRGAGGSSMASTERQYWKKGELRSYWIRATDARIAFGGGDIVGENEVRRVHQA